MKDRLRKNRRDLPTAKGFVLPDRSRSLGPKTVSKKMMFVFGTRPEAIKMAAMIREAKKSRNRLISSVVVTGQHRSLLDPVLDYLGLGEEPVRSGTCG